MIIIHPTATHTFRRLAALQKLTGMRITRGNTFLRLVNQAPDITDRAAPSPHHKPKALLVRHRLGQRPRRWRERGMNSFTFLTVDGLPWVASIEHYDWRARTGKSPARLVIGPANGFGVAIGSNTVSITKASRNMHRLHLDDALFDCFEGELPTLEKLVQHFNNEKNQP